MQRPRDLGQSVLNGKSPSNPSCDIREPCKRGSRKSIGARGDGGHLEKKRSLNQHNQNTYELTKTEAACTGPVTGPSHV